jgi:hypothetical protein
MDIESEKTDDRTEKWTWMIDYCKRIGSLQRSLGLGKKLKPPTSE